MDLTSQMEHEVNRALKILKQGGAILYPTDTIWGIGCDATNKKAIDKIYTIKQRSEKKSMIILVDTPYRISLYVKKVNELIWELSEVSDRPLTIVFPDAMNLPDNLIHADGTVAIRVAKDPFCKSLISKLQLPIVSTSANISDQPHPENFYDIDYNIIKSVDYVVDWRQSERKKAIPSRIIRMNTDGTIDELRK